MVTGQVSFSKGGEFLLGDLNRSKVPIAVVDINGDRLDDVVVLDNGNRLKAYYQTQESGVFFKKDYGMVSPADQFALGLGDLDNDGLKEIFVGGLYDGVKIYKSFGGTMDYLQWQKTGIDFYTQNISCVDYDNDGFLDLHVNDDDGFPKLYRNLGGTTLEEIDPFNYEFSGETASGNYGSIWTDFDDDGDLDLYISKCRLGVDSSEDLRRINQLWVNNGEGVFAEQAGLFGLDIGEQSWVTDFSDLDNDGDKDVIMINHTGANYIFENRGDLYQLLELDSTWDQLFEGLQLIVRDLDNDGLKDILIAGFESKLFWNKGGMVFKEDSSFLQNQEALSLAMGDLNNDGFWDLYVGFARGITQANEYVPDAFLFNMGNDNNYLKLSLEGTESNREAIGATCQLYGTWGVQTYEIRSGESYGINNSRSIVFGLGAENRYDSLVVTWPDGLRQHYLDLEINTHNIIQENACVSSHATIENEGEPILCNSTDAVILKAREGSLYLWSNGESAQEIEVSQPGLYNVTVTNLDGCDFISGSVLVRDQSSIRAPKIVNLHPQRLYCFDDVVTLSTQYPEVSWSDGSLGQVVYAFAQDTVVADLEICDGLSLEPYTANTAKFESLEAKRDTIEKGEDAIFTMNSLDVAWYQDLESMEPIGQGASFEIKELGVDTTIYASQMKSFIGKDSLNFAQEVLEFGFPPENINGGLIFSVEDFVTTLNSVKCFSDTSALRKIQIKDVWGNVLHEKEVLIGPSDSLVELDFDLLPSNYYLLTTDQNTNLVNLGSRSPQLRRSILVSSIVGQKSASGNVILRESTGSDNILYSFYDLKFTDYDFVCESQRVPFSMHVRQSSSTIETESDAIIISPNPFRDRIYIKHLPTKALDYQFLSASDEVLRKGRFEKEMDFTGFPPGVYFLRVGQKVRKLVKL